MGIDEYQKWTATTAIYNSHVYPALGLAEEAGEVCGLVAKSIRDLTPVDKDKLTKELGDTLWMLCRVAGDFQIPMTTVMGANMAKLESRKARNVIGGSGDER